MYINICFKTALCLRLIKILNENKNENTIDCKRGTTALSFRRNIQSIPIPNKIFFKNYLF
jgi:hypothetical protein